MSTLENPMEPTEFDTDRDAIRSTNSSLDRREQSILQSLSNSRGLVSVQRVTEVLDSCGLLPDDPRLAGLQEGLRGYGVNDEMTGDEFLRSARSALLIIEQMVSGNLVIPEFTNFRDEIEKIFEDVRNDTSGAIATYIPKLGRADPDRYGLSLCTIDGQRASFGDSKIPFSAQCIHKPLTYALALEDNGAEAVHKRIGYEPSGRGFNEIALDSQGRPHNPMLNSGSIMCCSMIKPSWHISDRFEHILDLWEAMAGGRRPGFDNATYLSERRTADRNNALTYYMKEHNAFPEDSDAFDALDLYLQSCSLEVTTETVSIVAATLATGGICPLTGRRVLEPQTVRRCLSLMYNCGMYDYSGRWAFAIGLPAKSGVSGGVMVVVPNVIGLCVWSPRLEPHGNSVRGIEFCRAMVKRFNFHVYDNVGNASGEKIDPRQRAHARDRDLLVDLCWAASEGDCDGMTRLVIKGADVNGADYDGRTPLHLAAAERRTEAVELLLRLGANRDAVDRWGSTARADAERVGATEILALLD
jgi:glutaminase